MEDVQEFTCSVCRYFKRIVDPTDEELGIVSGECRRSAPRPLVGSKREDPIRFVDWPIVPGHDWCGDGEERGVELTDEEVAMLDKGYPLAALHSVTQRKLTK